MSESQSLYGQYMDAAAGCKKPAEIITLQKKMLLPVIEEEKAAFIRAEYGRLQHIMGAAYNEGGELHFFHPLPENRRDDDTAYGDPEELTLAELAMLPHLVHVVPRLGTESTVPLIQYFPEDKFRMQLLAGMFDRISIGVPCSETGVRILLNGHGEYINFKTGNEVIVIK